MTHAHPSSAPSLASIYRVPPDLLRGLFRRMNRFMVGMFRLGLGPYISNPYTGYIMVITTTGRRSGLPHRTPVNFIEEAGQVYCMAGFGERSDWYRNVRANPRVHVWVGGHGWEGQAELVTDQSQWVPLYRRIAGRAGFADRAFTKLQFSHLSDDEILSLAGQTPVVRIRLDRPLPADQQPGDLRWLWPVLAATFLAGWRLRRGGRRR